jgi:hypothetical protein
MPGPGRESPLQVRPEPGQLLRSGRGRRRDFSSGTGRPGGSLLARFEEVLEADEDDAAEQNQQEDQPQAVVFE